MKKAFAYLFPVVVWMGIIFFVSSIATIPRINPDIVTIRFFDTAIIYHFCAFFMLALLVRRAAMAYNVPAATAIAILFTVTYGLTDEVHQLFVPSRTFQVSDLFLDAGGAFSVLSLNIKTKVRQVRNLTKEKQASSNN